MDSVHWTISLATTDRPRGAPTNPHPSRLPPRAFPSRPPGLDLKLAFALLGAAVVFSGVYGFFLDPGAQP